MYRWTNEKNLQFIRDFTRVSKDRVCNICTWFYIAAQMIQRVNGIIVTLNRIIPGELTPT